MRWHVIRYLQLHHLRCQDSVPNHEAKRELSFLASLNELPVFVLEIGFSEDYNDLLESADLSLNGMRSVRLCGLVNLVETPKCLLPTANLS